MSDTWFDGRPPPGLGFRLVALFLEEGRLGLHLQLVLSPRVTLYAEEKSPLALRRENCPNGGCFAKPGKATVAPAMGLPRSVTLPLMMMRGLESLHRDSAGVGSQPLAC